MSERPFVALTNFELTRVLAGNPMTCRLSDGTDVVVRLATADEFLAAHEAACRAFGVEPSLTRDQAIQLTTPIRGER